MKLLKVTALFFFATLVFSSAKAFADNNYYFAGMYMNGFLNVYSSPVHTKLHATNQQFTLTSCYDTSQWNERNLKVRVSKYNINSHTDYKELSGGSTATYSESLATSANTKYYLDMKVANPLVSEVYLNGTWYLD